MSRTPALFIGHGSPMNTLELNGYTEAWRALGQSLPRPRAVLSISAHWYFGATAVTAMARPRTIHDFYGFPEDLFAFEYPAAGSPELAGEIAELVKPNWMGLDRDQWGIDHGTWSVLAHLYPEADIPVVQLSLNAHRSLEYHLDLASKLTPLRDQGVMILASGNVVHNLRELRRDAADLGFDWNRRLDDAVAEQLRHDPSDILKVTRHPDFARAAPTPEHFLPVLYLAGLAAAGEAPVETLAQGYSMGSLSMACYGLDAHAPVTESSIGAAQVPREVPPEQTNI